LRRNPVFIASNTDSDEISSEICSSDLLVLPKNSGLGEFRQKLEELPNEKIVVRAEDVPLFLELLALKGKGAVGLTGEDLFREYLLNNPKSLLRVKTRIPWQDINAKYGKPTVCLLGKTIPKNPIIAINRKYSSLAEKEVSKLNPKQKIYFNGSTETAVIQGIVDLVVDIVYSGKSAEDAGMDVLKRIYSSDAVLLEVRK
jgi:ATP phosphoribosyltransferase